MQNPMKTLMTISHTNFQRNQGILYRLWPWD